MLSAQEANRRMKCWKQWKQGRKYEMLEATETWENNLQKVVPRATVDSKLLNYD